MTTPASKASGRFAVDFYADASRQSVYGEILKNDEALRVRFETSKGVEALEEEQYRTEQELFTRSLAIIKERYNNQLSKEEQHVYELQAKNYKIYRWRCCRKEDDLIEDEESLAQKAEDDKLLAQGFTIDDLIEGKHLAQ